jgi:putative endonuclease
MKTKRYWVYLLASRRDGTLYIGATSDLVARIHQHKCGVVPGFTQRHGVSSLVWFEEQADAYAMVTRERRIKAWQRAWKVRLIEECNPMWHDLYGQLLR